jgi:hypothetical protein
MVVSDDHVDRSRHPWRASLHAMDGSGWRGPIGGRMWLTATLVPAAPAIIRAALSW